MNKSTQIWKVAYGLSIVKDDEEDDNDEDIIEGGIEMNMDEKAIAEVEKQEE